MSEMGRYDMALKSTAVYRYPGRYIVLLRSFYVRHGPSCLGFVQVASSCENLRTKSSSFPRGSFDNFCRACSFTRVRLAVASALTLATTCFCMHACVRACVLVSRPTSSVRIIILHK